MKYGHNFGSSNKVVWKCNSCGTIIVSTRPPICFTDKFGQEYIGAFKDSSWLRTDAIPDCGEARKFNMCAQILTE